MFIIEGGNFFSQKFAMCLFIPRHKNKSKACTSLLHACRQARGAVKDKEQTSHGLFIAKGRRWWGQDLSSIMSKQREAMVGTGLI